VSRTTGVVWLDGHDGERRSVPVRAEVAAFAIAMERRLRANDHKGDWKDCDSAYLIRRLREECDELSDEVTLFNLRQGRVTREAADVANFALMLADVFGDLMRARS
jgi:NTP pyrophosphatase (non-canonical NTP hydrolase)